MRQAIKGDGSDGTAALKAYLLTHREVLSKEIYELTRPGIGAGLGTTPALFMPTTDGVAVQDTSPSADPAYGTASVAASSGELDQWESHSLSFWGKSLHWSYSPAGDYGAPGGDAVGARPRSQITQILAVTSGYEKYPWFAFVDYSIDGGTTWLGLARVGTSVQEFSQDITSALISHFGSIAAVDFTQIQFRAYLTTSLNFNLFPDFNSFVITSVGLRFIFGPLAPAGTLAPVLLGRFTDSSSPLTYAGHVYTPANIKNNGFKSKIGLDVDSLELNWSFRGDEPMVTDPGTGATILTMLQGFRYGLWDGIWVKWLRVYMPTFGDCDSLGAVRMFRGRMAEPTVDRLTAKMTVNSVTEMFNRQVPQQLIEANNRSQQVGPGLPPDLNPDPAHWTSFQCVAGHGGTVQKIVASQTAPTAGQIYAPGTFDLGYLLFQASPLLFFVAQVARYDVEAGFNVFYLFKPLYVDPHAYNLSFFGFIPVPRDQTVSGASGVTLPGFPHVPLPEQAV